MASPKPKRLTLGKQATQNEKFLAIACDQPTLQKFFKVFWPFFATFDPIELLGEYAPAPDGRANGGKAEGHRAQGDRAESTGRQGGGTPRPDPPNQQIGHKMTILTQNICKFSQQIAQL